MNPPGGSSRSTGRAARAGASAPARLRGANRAQRQARERGTSGTPNTSHLLQPSPIHPGRASVALACTPMVPGRVALDSLRREVASWRAARRQAGGRFATAARLQHHAGTEALRDSMATEIERLERRIDHLLGLIANQDARASSHSESIDALRARPVDAITPTMAWIEQATLATTPLVSVVLPTRNRAQCLPTAIASVLAQTYPRWELLIVDDGSEDETAELLASLSRPSPAHAEPCPRRRLRGPQRGARARRGRDRRLHRRRQHDAPGLAEERRLGVRAAARRRRSLRRLCDRRHGADAQARPRRSADPLAAPLPPRGSGGGQPRRHVRDRASGRAARGTLRREPRADGRLGPARAADHRNGPPRAARDRLLLLDPRSSPALRRADPVHRRRRGSPPGTRGTRPRLARGRRGAGERRDAAPIAARRRPAARASATGRSDPPPWRWC